MSTKLPNLELLLYKAKLILNKSDDFLRAITEIKKSKKRIYLDYSVEVFPQLWGNTCTGFDLTTTGEPAVGGDAMTTEYTTVVHEAVTNSYCVFFGDEPCYIVFDPTEKFFRDLAKKNMASLSHAKKFY